MHLRNVKIFCDVAACRSFSKAAELHQISQPAVSQAVHALEDKLNCRLIDRSQRPLGLTEAGKYYLDGVRGILSSLDKLEQNVQEIENRVTAGTLRISAIYSIGLLRMDGYIKAFQELYPDAVIEVEYAHPDVVYQHVREESAELGLVSFPKESGEFQSEPWQEQSIQLVVPAGHPLCERDQVSLRELEGESWIAFTSELPIRKKLDRWLKKAGVGLKIRHEFDNIENIKRDVEIGSGIAFLPLETVEREVELELLHAIPITDIDWTRPLGIVSKRRRRFSPAARKFIELLKSDGKPMGIATGTPVKPTVAFRQT
ncbi:MAG: LysR family transcriptional regulator [Planctomycetaceae bacterium]|jgi:DNA-binding transcriptional LysR family regulator|nr:LysR family transcriptional regulator [bacterium]MDC0274340.1 LysR family transcriptional regulator [Planctomycetaceae bacterium]MDG2390980.1 LysR family transcriptional regulator [Planctomycetaceae bacterium]